MDTRASHTARALTGPHKETCHMKQNVKLKEGGKCQSRGEIEVLAQTTLVFPNALLVKVFFVTYLNRMFGNPQMATVWGEKGAKTPKRMFRTRGFGKARTTRKEYQNHQKKLSI
eukprot:4493471-Amphidinium_carterae.1